MRYILDTCAFIDFISDYDRLGRDVMMLIEDFENQMCVTHETIREVILKYKLGKFGNKIWPTAEDIVRAFRDEYNFTILPLDLGVLRAYARLEPNEAEDHKDPSDHIIIAQAIAYKLPLISCDRKFVFYRQQGLNLIRYGRYAHEG